jgi:copper chaperone CopZ/bacterioferritin-associated ferredoxin
MGGEQLKGENICGRCGGEGMKVLPLTLGAHLAAEHWSKIDGSFYFCPTRGCEVVYFSNRSGVYFTKAEVKTRVGIKEEAEPKPLCYCNRVTEEMLRRAILEEGCCSSMEEVQRHTGAGKGRWCVVTNPSGRCCEWYLKDIIAELLAGAKRKGGAERRGSMRRVVLEIGGMTCPGCAGVVQAALESAGASEVKVSFNKGRAEVLLEEGAEVQEIIRAVRQAGYSAKVV